MHRRKPTTIEPIGETWFLVVLLHAAIAVAAWMGLTAIEWETPAPSPSSESVQLSTEVLLWRSPSVFTSDIDKGSVVTSEVAEALPARKEAKPEPVEKVLEMPPVAERVPTVAESARMVPADFPSEDGNEGRQPKREANRFITLSRLTSDLAEPPAPFRSSTNAGRPVPTLLDVAKLNEIRPYNGQLGTLGDTSVLDKVDAAVQKAFLENWMAPTVDKVDPEKRSAHLEVSIGKDGTVLGTLLSRPSGSEALDQSVESAAQKVTKIPLSLPAGFGRPFYELQVNFQID